MAGVHLAIKVKQLLLGPETEEQGLYCVFSTGSTRFSSSKAVSEVFLVSPWELSHATKKPLPVSPSTQHDHSQPLTSPVLTVELYSAKRWGADAVIAAGELLLGPLLKQLQSNGPGVCVTLALAKAGAKAASKAASKPPSSAAAAGAGAATPDGSDARMTVVLQLSTVTAPVVPEQLLGPVGSGHVEVPPRFCADASWLSWRQPLLHTGAGHLYQAPTVQLMRVTVHKAQGLQNLHVDPLAAAAAAAAMGRMAATGSSPSRTDRAKAVAERAMMDGTKVGRNLLQQTSSWFKRTTSSAGAAAPAAAARPSFLAPSKSSLAQQSTAPINRTPSSSPTAAAWFPASEDGSAAAPGPTSAGNGSPDPGKQTPAAAAATESAAAAGAGASARNSSEQLAAAAGAAAAAGDGPRSLQHSLSGSSSGSGSGSASGAGRLASPLAPSPHTSSGAAAEQAVERAVADVGAAAAAPKAEEAKAGHGSLADPVSLLKQATRHTRNSSVDAEAVMAALEENGFHSTDAYMGAFFYTRVSLVGTGEAGSSSAAAGSSSSSSSCCCTKVVALTLGGEAAWDQGFWLPLVRPAPASAALELELYAAKDDKTRGKLVASVKAPLQQLLPQGQHGPSDLPWPMASHMLQASFSDHLHCSFSLTVEVADWDLRAQLAGIPRALTAAAAAAAAEASLSSSPAATPAAAGEVGPGAPPGASQASSVGAQRSDPSVLGSSAAVNAQLAADAAAAVGSMVQQPPPVAVLDLVVKAFDTQRALDVFFVLLLGPYCLVSNTSHSTQHHHWGWHLKLPLAQPDEVLTLALLAREDQAGGRKRMGAPLLTMLGSSVKLVGKLRIRLSCLQANTPLNLSMPLQGERTNLRAGPASAATAHLYLNLAVPHLLGTYLPAYARFSVCSPQLYLLANSPGVVGPDSTLDALAAEVQATTAKWVEQQPPWLPAKVFRKVQDDGRSEFTLSRTRDNWRRLTLLRDATAPARQLFAHLCSWSNPLHSGGWYCVILLFGLFPSRVLAVLLVLLAFALLRKVKSPAQTVAVAGAAATAAAAAAAAATSTKGTKGPGTAAQAAAAAAGAVVVASSASRSSGGWRLLPVQPPPVMWNPSYALPDDSQQTGALPTDPYTSLKQNYEAVIGFLTLVQNVIDVWASAGERIQLAFCWTDPLATGVLLVLMLLLALGLWVLGLQVLVTAGLLWVFRHPVLRTPLPPPPVNFVWRLPTRADTML